MTGTGDRPPRVTVTRFRRMADEELVRRVLEDPEGPEAMYLRDRLAGYTVPILERWGKRGRLRDRAMSAIDGGPVLGAGKVGPDKLANDQATSLAGDVVMSAWRYFMPKALEKWDPTLGRRLESYFVTTCLMKLPDVYPTWARKELRPAQEWVSLDGLAETVQSDSDPEGVAVLRDRLRRIERDEPVMWAVGCLAATGMNNQKIARTLSRDGFLMSRGRVGEIRRDFTQRARDEQESADD